MRANAHGTSIAERAGPACQHTLLRPDMVCRISVMREGRAQCHASLATTPLSGENDAR